MNKTRRNFVQGCAAACTLLLPGLSNIAKATGSTAGSVADVHIEKSIKASFGGGFSLRAHAQSNGLTHATIEHLGNRYTVASSDLLDWKIVSPH